MGTRVCRGFSLLYRAQSVGVSGPALLFSFALPARCRVGGPCLTALFRPKLHRTWAFPTLQSARLEQNWSTSTAVLQRCPPSLSVDTVPFNSLATTPQCNARDCWGWGCGSDIQYTIETESQAGQTPAKSCASLSSIVRLLCMFYLSSWSKNHLENSLTTGF